MQKLNLILGPFQNLENNKEKTIFDVDKKLANSYFRCRYK